MAGGFTYRRCEDTEGWCGTCISSARRSLCIAHYRAVQIVRNNFPNLGLLLIVGLGTATVAFDATQALNLSAGVSKLQGLTWPFV
jgi:hypothetical protein